MSRRFRIGLVTDSPFAYSGYGVQANLFAPLIAEHYDLVVYAMSYLGHRALEHDGYTLVSNPRGDDPFCLKTMASFQKEYDIDALLTLKDPYIYTTEVVSQLKNWFPFVPIDTEPMTPLYRVLLPHAVRPIAIAPNGVNELAVSGFRPLYMPLGYDDNIFKTIPKHEARAKLNWDQDKFIALFVGANQSTPSRKGLEALLNAWAMFTARNPDSMLYLHTRMYDTPVNSIDINAYLYCMKLTDSVLATEPKRYDTGIDPEMLNLFYNAADVTVNPAEGGGFELALLESQAVGTPVITTNFTAMRDLVWGGWRLYEDGIPRDQLRLDTLRLAWRLSSKASDIAEALQLAYADRDNEELSNFARQGAQRYEYRRIFEHYWLPALKMIERESRLADAKRKQAQLAEQRQKSYQQDFAKQVAGEVG